jgi:hypothetical protein
VPVTLYLVRCNIGTLLLRLEVLEIGKHTDDITEIYVNTLNNAILS